MKPKRKIGRIVLILLLAVLAGAAGTIYVVFSRTYGKANYVRDEDVELDMTALAALESESEILPDSDPAELLTETETEQNSESAAEDQTESLSETESETEVLTESHTEAARARSGAVAQATAKAPEGTYSILLIGADRQETSRYGSADAMILATVNDNAEDIFLITFDRDLYADIPQVGGRRLSSAYTVGGGPLLVKTLEVNYGVAIDNYAAVDYEGMAEIIRILSNGKAEIRAEEIRDMQSEERKDLLRSVFSEFRQNPDLDSPAGIKDLSDQILPLVTHNISQLKLLGFMASISKIKDYEVVTDRIPFDGLYRRQGNTLVPDMQATADKLKETIYVK